MPDEQTSTRICKQCGQVSPIAGFLLNKRSGSMGHQCAACRSATYRKYRLLNCLALKIKRQQKYRENRAEAIAKVTEWGANNPDKVKANKQRYADLHRDEKRKKNREWSRNNKDKMRALRKAWMEANPGYKKSWEAENRDKINAYSHARRAKYRGSYTIRDVRHLLKIQKNCCANPTCGIDISKDYTIDHVEPINAGGSNGPENLQLLCADCNRRKSYRDPFEWAQSIGRLFV